MGIMDDYYKAKAKSSSSKKASTGGSTASASGGSNSFIPTRFDMIRRQYEEDDIAPILSMTRLKTSSQKKKKDEEKLDFFQKGALEDGITVGNVTKAILGTAGDAGLNVARGALSLGEGLVDLVDYGIAGIADRMGYTDFADSFREAAQENLVGKGTQGMGDWLDQYSVLGRTSDAILQGVGQVGGIMATGGLAAGAGLSASAVTTGVMGLSGMGSGMGEAYQGGATDEEALAYGAISGAADALTEMLFGGLGKAVNAVGLSKGLSSADDMLAKTVSKKFRSQIAKNFAEFGVKASAEGLEEVLAGTAQAMGKKLTYMSENDFKDILKDENLLEQFIVGSVTSGMIQSGIVPGTKNGSLIEANKNQTDFLTGTTKNEKAVIDRLVADRIAEREKKGEEVSKRAKADIEEAVIKELERGYISTDTIEEVLGGGDYQNYLNLKAESDEYNTLYETESGKLSEKQKDRLAELKERNKAKPYKDALKASKKQLYDSVFEVAKGDRLVESYNERARAKQDFVADYDKFKDSKFGDAAKKTLDNAVKAGANNTNRVRDFVEFVAKTSGDTGLSFDFKSGEQIKEDFIQRQTAEIQKIEKSIEQLKGKTNQKGKNAKLIAEQQQKLAKLQDLLSKVKSGETKVNGNITDNGIVLNLNSEKPLNRIIGHEVSHSFETAKNYKALKEHLYSYAKSKGVDIDAEIESRKLMYEGVKGADAEAELVADLVGDYLFSDQDYIKNLSSQNRNVFQKLWDEVKHLCKLATAGSKEARELERVRKAFEDAYRESGKAKADANYSLHIKHTDGSVEVLADARNLTDERAISYLKQAKSGSLRGETYIPVRKDTPQVLIDTLTQAGENIENRSLVMQVRKAQQAMASENPGKRSDKYGSNVRKHSLSPTELVEIVNKLDDPSMVILQTERQDKHGNPLPNNVAVFVEYSNNGNEGVAVIEFDSSIDPASIGTEFGETSYHTVVTAFEPDTERNGMPYDYAEELLSKPNNYELEIKRRQPEESATREKHPNTFDELPSFYTSVSQKGENVNNSLDQNEQGLSREEEVSYSLSKDTEYMDKAIAMNASSFRVDTKTLEETKALRERIAGRMNDIKNRGLVGLPEDIEGNTYIANSSYDGTEENTTICPRSLASEAFVDAVSEYLGRPLTVEEQIYISQDLQGRRLTPECTYCYVATDRKAYRAFLGEYVAQRDAVLQKVKDNPNADVSRSGELYKEFLNGRKDTNPMYSRFKMWVDAYKNGKPMIDASHLANINKLMGDINSEFGAELKPQITDAMKYAQSASWAKKRVNYVAYNGHILKWKQDRINKLNSHYGLRMYSFSDFHPAFVLENMQMITDASVRGLKMLGYTKDTDFVEIFAPSGMNINVSTFGFEAGGEVFENNHIGAEWEKAKALREQYPNVGITFVATNDTLVNWAMDQDWIDVIIPFHLVRTGREVAKAFNYHDYTNESSDVKTKEWKKGDKKYIAPTEHNNDKATYLAALEKNHLKPRFERFIDNPNYMKLVNECRQPATVSKPVQPVFNEDAAMVALAKLEANGYYQPIGGSVDRMYEIAGEVAEAMTQQIAPAYSMSNADEQFTPESDFDFYGRDFGKQEEDIAPVAETETTAQDAPIYESDDESAPEGQTSMFEPVEETPKRSTRKEYHRGIIDRIKSRFAERGFDFDKVLKNAKNLSTWSTVDNTPQRVMEKALGYKEGGILADITVNQVAQNESEGIKWINKNVELLKQISKDYNIKPGSKESAAAQMYAEGFYVNDNNEIVRYGDPELIQDFGDATVRQNIKRLARDPRIRKIYDDTLASINESRTRNLYPEIPRLDNYFLHFRAMNDTFSTLGLPFNPNDIRAKDLPTDLNGVTADLKPGQPYFASANHRTGKRTSFDMLGGIERYLTSAKNQIYHIDDIQTLRALRNYIAETYGQATGLEDLDSLTDAEAEERIKQVYGAHLSTFAKFLNEEANVLAGKTALIDRGVEGIIGRRGITFLNTLNGQVGSNMVGYNISSSLTNFLPVAQTLAKSNKYDFFKAFTQTVANKFSGGKFDSFAEDSPVVIRRKGEDRFYQTPWQKLSNPGYALMGMVDDISTEIIARTKYNEFTRKGMDSQKAHFETDKWVSRLMGDRSLGQMPQLYNSKMLGLITKFQLEVRNQLDAQFYDTIQETKASNEHIQDGLARNVKTAAQVASTFTQLAVAQHLFGIAFESIAGYNPAFDIIEVLATAFGFDDEEDSEDTALDNFAQGLLALAEDMPYASTFTGGRVPISDAIPDVPAILRGEDEYGNEIGIPQALTENVAEIAPYYLMPAGYGQAKKTIAGLKMFSDDHPIAGSYTDAGNLRFPVEDTLANRIHAGIFGQYASENARKYFDEEQRTLNPDQTKILAGLDVPVEEYWEYRDNLNEFYDLKDQMKEAAYADGATSEDSLKYKHINTVYNEIYDLYDQQKELADGNSPNKQAKMRDIQRKMSSMLTSSKSEVDNAFITSSYAEVGDRRYNYDAEKGTWYEIKAKNADGSDNWYYQKEQEVTEGLGISYSEYWSNREEYNYAYDKPGRYAIAKVVGGYDSYQEYYDALENWQSDTYLASDKDSKGNSISGSRKRKVIEYINNLNMDEGEKMILYRTVYSSKTDKRKYNMEIVNYLNGRKDISYKEKKAILEELEMEVDSEGYISW